MRIAISLTTMLIMVSAGAHAQTEYTFRDFDSDGNLELSEREFGLVGDEAYASAGSSADQGLAQAEFDRLIEQLPAVGGRDFAQWDTDDSGRIERSEFNEMLFLIYDADADETISQEEFAGLQDELSRQAAGRSAGESNASESDAARSSAAGSDAADGNDSADITQITPTDSADGTLRARITSLGAWSYDQLYSGGMSAEAIIDNADVYGPEGEEIGEVEDILLGSDGTVVAIIAEVGGLWDIGDTHVSVPWDEVEISGDRIVTSVTEDNAAEHGVYDNGRIARSEAAATLLSGVEDAMAGDRLWRASELIGDYARLREEGSYVNYGYVNDIILGDGEVTAVVVEPDGRFGFGGYQAYPYYGYDRGHGWTPGSPYYDLPYRRDESAQLGAFEPGRLRND